jgi:hypothetical protein
MTSIVFASLASRSRRSGLRGSTYGLGKRLFTQAMGGRVKKVYDFTSSLAAALLNGLFDEHPASLSDGVCDLQLPGILGIST